jgi:hypothetical protein
VSFIPQSIDWPSDRAVLLVHGIGNASVGADGAFPLDALRDSLGDKADETAIYRLNYDFINDWAATKVDFAAAIALMKKTVCEKLGSDDAAETLADYIGDVLWPVMSASIRFAVRDALIAQLAQIQLDRTEAALTRGQDPLDYRISIVAHSLGCYHAYETLWAIATEPRYQLMPRSDRFTFNSVILMASPVQLIRTVAGKIDKLVPDIATVAALSHDLAIPAETHGSKGTPCTSHFISVCGTKDPVGGHLLGDRLPWAFMDLPGQELVVDPQQLLNFSSTAELAAVLRAARRSGGPGVQVDDPHSWTSYIARHGELLRGALL